MKQKFYERNTKIQLHQTQKKKRKEEQITWTKEENILKEYFHYSLQSLQMKNLSRSGMFAVFLRVFTGLCLLASLFLGVISVASHRWIEKYAKNGTQFYHMGLWKFCDMKQCHVSLETGFILNNGLGGKNFLNCFWRGKRDLEGSGGNLRQDDDSQTVL